MEPVSLEQAKARLGVRSNHRDAELAGLIPAARLLIESLTGHILVRRQVRQFVRSYCAGDPIELHAWPVISVDAVQALDSDGAWQDVVGARHVSDFQPGRVFPAVGSSWPPQGNPAGLSLLVTAGYDPEAPAGSEDAVPEDLLQALLLVIGHWFENHEAVVVGSTAVDLPLGVRDICSQYRLPGVL